MSKKKKKSSAAENLIESLMDDLKDIHDESSYKSAVSVDENENRFDQTKIANNILSSFEGNVGKDLEKGIEKELDSFEFTGGVGENPILVDEPSPGLEMPDGILSVVPSAEEERYDGPSADAVYQSPSVILEMPLQDSSEKSKKEEKESKEELLQDPIKDPVADLSLPEVLAAPVLPTVEESTRPAEDKTMSIQQEMNNASSALGTTESENTVAVEGFANARVGGRAPKNVDVKVSIGSYRGSRSSANVLTSIDASLVQAENLKLAQQRILELEKEVENLRAENEDLASAGEIIRSRADELGICVAALEKEKVEIKESAQSEMLILKGNLQYKENEVAKARVKVEELETRLKSDFKKIRVRERELENRLELLRAEKSALVRSKDEYILEQKRKIDQLSQELDNYRKKCLELNKTIEANQDQVKRTERALRLALINLEAKEENNGPLKKAE